MSTRSRIAIKQKDGTYKSIYCHSDGYLEYNGVILNKYYQDETKINLLINLSEMYTYVIEEKECKLFLDGGNIFTISKQ